jgi:hypothetical protein
VPRALNRALNYLRRGRKAERRRTFRVRKVSIRRGSVSFSFLSAVSDASERLRQVADHGTMDE